MQCALPILEGVGWQGYGMIWKGLLVTLTPKVGMNYRTIYDNIVYVWTIKRRVMEFFNDLSSKINRSASISLSIQIE